MIYINNHICSLSENENEYFCNKCFLYFSKYECSIKKNNLFH